MTVAQQLEQYNSGKENFDIPHYQFKLDNGLQVIVIEDNSVPLVEVSVQYNVGSKDEPEGLKGFAHLFEHLMFCGTKNHPGSYLANLLNAGAVDINGYTTRDKTYYYETVPTSALDYALFAESDRMGYFEESLSQEMLDQQIGIVINEKDQRESEPYGRLFEYFSEVMLPAEHPYRHPVIGYKEDVQFANLEKARKWFRKYYRPSNAILTLAGDIDVETAKTKVNQYFGGIETGTVSEHRAIGVPYIHGEVKGVFYDKIVEPHLYFIWQLPDKTNHNTILISKFISLLAGSKTSYLNRILVEEKKIAKNVHIDIDTGKLCSQLFLSITPNQDISLTKLEEEIKELLPLFFEREINDSNIDRIRSKKRSEFIFHIETLSYRSSVLIDSLSNYGDSHGYKKGLQLIDRIDTLTLKKIFKSLLNERVGIFNIYPHALIQNNKDKSEQRIIPEIGTIPLIQAAKITHGQLDNGLEVIWAEKKDSAEINLKVDYAFGYLSRGEKQYGWIPFINRLKNDSNQGNLDHIEFRREFEKFGASYGLSSQMYWTQAYLKTTHEDFERLLPLFNDYLFKTQFSETKFEQEKEKLLIELSKPFASSADFESYVYNSLVYPKNHPLAEPSVNDGTYQSMEKITFEDVLTFHQKNHVSKIKRLVIVGGKFDDKIFSALNRYFGHLPKYEYSSPDVPLVQTYKKSKVYLIQDETAIQDNIILSTMLSPDIDANDPAYGIFKHCFSHNFNSRVNLNLRENKTWTYGVNGFGTSIPNAINYGISVGVEQLHTLDTIKEILKEFHQLLTSNPIEEEEHSSAIKALNLKLIPILRTNSSIAQHVLWLARKQYSDNWIEQQQNIYHSLTLTDTLEFIQKYLSNNEWIWIIRGDVLRIKDEIATLNIGEIEVLEPNRHGYYD